MLAWITRTTKKRTLFIWNYSGWPPHYGVGVYVGYGLVLLDRSLGTGPLGLWVASVLCLAVCVDPIIMAVVDRRRRRDPQ